MEQYIIKGGNPLVGEVEIGGAKNAALGILAEMCIRDSGYTTEYDEYIVQDGEIVLNMGSHSAIVLKPVSYTHLDVYKRQVYGKWIRPLLELSREEIEQWLKDCDIRYCVDAVSYTHLDVYKRQVLDDPERNTKEKLCKYVKEKIEKEK